MFCPHCRDEFREGFTWCPDCAVALVEELVPDADVTPPPIAPTDRETEPETEAIPEDFARVTVGRYFNTFEAQTSRMALEQAGLRAWLSDENIGASYGVGIGTGLEVRKQDEAAARAVLEADAAAASAFPADPPELFGEPGRSPDLIQAAEIEPTSPPTEVPGQERRRLERLELVAVVLVACVYPIASNFWRGTEPEPIRPNQLTANIPRLAGLTLIVWVLLRRGPGPLSPMRLPRSAMQWAREIVAGFLLFAALWVALYPVLFGVLRRLGVPDALTPWDAFFRGPGVAAVFALESFFAAVYEEVVFRAYLISRLSLVLPRHRAWPVLVAAALCAFMHGYAPRSTVIVFADAVAYGLVYSSTRSLPRLVTAHWLHNLAVMSHYLPAK